MPFIMTVEGLDRVERAFNKTPELLAEWLQRAVVAGAAEITKRAVRGNVPYKTGRLAQSIGRPPRGLVIEPLKATVRPQTDYAYFVHEGTRPHQIRPKEKKALFWQGAKHPLKLVNHPGTKANQFMPRLLELSKQDIDRHFSAAVDESLKQAGF